jgi:hypothetical protein
MLVAVTLAAPSLVGCVGSYGDAKTAGMADRGEIGARPTPSLYCQSVDARRDTWGAIAKFTALVSAGVAAAAAAIKDDKTQVGFAIGAATGTGVSGGEFYYSETQGKLWARDCSDK